MIRGDVHDSWKEFRVFWVGSLLSRPYGPSLEGGEIDIFMMD